MSEQVNEYCEIRITILIFPNNKTEAQLNSGIYPTLYYRQVTETGFSDTKHSAIFTILHQT